MVEMVIRMQGDKAGIKRLMQEIEIIRLFSVFHEPSQLQERKMFSIISAMEKGHYACDCQKPRVHDAKYFREQILLGMKDETGIKLNNEEYDFLLETSHGEETIKELTAAVMLMARIQPVDGNAQTVPSYDANAISEVNASSKVKEQMRHEKRKTII
nr:hypothetical protein [Tanacetum cinerariifolium]